MWPFPPRKSRPGPRAARARAYRPRLEALEDRCLLNAGALDPTFGSGGIVTTALTKTSDKAYGLLLQPNGNLIAYGDAQNSKSADQFGLARYTPAGKLDTAFGSGGIVITTSTAGDFVERAALQPDGKIVAAGFSKYLVRYNSNGSLDPTFGSGGIVTYPSNWAGMSLALLIQPNGDIVVGGRANISGQAVGALLRYTPSGALEPTFGSGGELLIPAPPGVTVNIGALALANGAIMVGGEDYSSPYSQPQPWSLRRYTLSGSLDTSFGTGGVVETVVSSSGPAQIYKLLVQPDGRIVAVGQAHNSANQSVWGLARYNADGGLDSSFGTGGIVTSSISGDDYATSAALQSNGQIVVTGRGNSLLEVGVYNPNGSPDTFFGSGGFVTQAVGSYAIGEGVVVQSDGKIVVAGLTGVGTDRFGHRVYNFLLARFGPSAAQIGSFTASAYTVTAGSRVTLTASNITLADPSSTITQVAFYYLDSSGARQVLGYGTQGSGGVWALPWTVSLTPGCSPGRGSPG
jgi:uncharacterized delta-60 repeat protein